MATAFHSANERDDMAQLDEISLILGKLSQSVDDIIRKLDNGVIRFGEHDKRIEKLETLEHERKGAVKFAYTLSALLGAVGAAIGAKLAALLGVNP